MRSLRFRVIVKRSFGKQCFWNPAEAGCCLKEARVESDQWRVFGASSSGYPQGSLPRVSEALQPTRFHVDILLSPGDSMKHVGSGRPENPAHVAWVQSLGLGQ